MIAYDAWLADGIPSLDLTLEFFAVTTKTPQPGICCFTGMEMVFVKEPLLFEKSSTWRVGDGFTISILV